MRDARSNSVSFMVGILLRCIMSAGVSTQPRRFRLDGRVGYCYHMGLHMSPERDQSLRVRVSDDELRMVQELAELDGITASDFVRLFIRREHAARIGEQKATKKTKR